MGGLTSESCGDPVSQVIRVTSTAVTKLGVELLMARSNFAAVRIGSHLYAIGGNAVYPKGAVTGVECIDLNDNKTTEKAPLTQGRCNQAMVAVGNRLYVIGGHDTSSALKSVEIYDTQTNTWSPGPELNQARDFHTAIVIDKQIYVIGASLTGLFYLPLVSIHGTINTLC
jgi:hypothetical protein